MGLMPGMPAIPGPAIPGRLAMPGIPVIPDVAVPGPGRVPGAGRVVFGVTLAGPAGNSAAGIADRGRGSVVNSAFNTVGRSGASPSEGPNQSASRCRQLTGSPRDLAVHTRSSVNPDINQEDGVRAVRAVLGV
ncbi:hypothetical protein Raf01_62130 [Rugosimonospora africana]|uniref:Uncharacterized protein n=1 Tax=Rugosimonospora africana TaxID=556532 RepID=A0A8J3VTT9_9ACTN|nr:hypothetical protein Raf01_62130 [Rugosimonospora africana]